MQDLSRRSILIGLSTPAAAIAIGSKSVSVQPVAQHATQGSPCSGDWRGIPTPAELGRNKPRI